MTPEEYDRAACRGRSDLEWGFHDDRRHQEADNVACKAVCASCPVWGPCLTQAMDNESPGLRYGIWGGLTAKERDAMMADPDFVAQLRAKMKELDQASISVQTPDELRERHPLR